MTRKTLAIAAIPVIALFFASAIPSAYAQEAIDAQKPPRFVAKTPERRAREFARKGVEELRRFIWRTRMIYALNIYDFRTPKK